jgi:glycosyltransferase involved in cell wall biosynthesis
VLTFPAIGGPEGRFGAEVARSPRTAKIVYLAPSDIQVARVDRQAIVYFCSALARAGQQVEIVAMRIRLSSAERHRSADPLALYAIQTSFPVDIVESRIHQDSPGWLIGLARLLIHTRAALKRSNARADDGMTVFYTKNYAPALALLALRKFRRIGLVFEVHTPPRSVVRRFVLRHVDGVVANSHALARDVGVVPRRLLALHQGIDLRPYRETDRAGLRDRLRLPSDRKLAVYTGKVYYRYKEVELILIAASDPQSANTLFVIVGGREDHVALWRSEVGRRGIGNVLFTGFVPPSIVHEYQMAADVLILYYPSGFDLNPYRSPGKLFGYMASGVPIVASDLPVLREVLGDPPAAFLVPQDAPRKLAHAIRCVLDQQDSAHRVALEARDRVEAFTWDERARRLIDFVREFA